MARGRTLVGGAGILGSAPKSGKSFFAPDLCVAVASATLCAGRFAISMKGRVTLLTPYEIAAKHLTAHGVILGMTASGKTGAWSSR